MCLMKLKYDFIIQKVGDTQVAVPAGDDVNRFSGIIKLNSTGAVIFKMLKNEISAEQIAQELVRRYGITPEEAEESTAKYLSSLIDSGVIEQ